MPVARYFLFAGGMLLALLLAINAFTPQEVAVASNAASSVDKTVVRIRSDQKLPERVVYDTSLPTIVPPTVATAKAPTPPAPAADVTAESRVRDTFAQFVPAEAKKPEQQVQRKRKIARSRPVSPMYVAQQPQMFAQQPQMFAQQPQMWQTRQTRKMRVAQQSHFGFFGGPGWNSTW